MRILRRYYLKEFFKLFAVASFGLGFSFSLMDLLNRITDFLPRHPSMADLLLYSALNFPQYLLYLMPMACLIGGLFVFGQAGRRKETTAIRASGGSIKSLLAPFVSSGVFLSIAAFLIGEFVVPDFSTRAHRLRDALAGRENVFTSKVGTVWLRAKDSIVKIDLFLPDKGIIRGVSIIKMEDSELTERVEAELAEWRPVWKASGGQKGGIWVLRDATKYTLRTGSVTTYRELAADVIEPPDVFREGMQKPDEMNLRELISYTEKLKNAGFRNSKLLVDIQSRISYPLVNTVMLTLGVALATSGLAGGGLITAAIGIFISLLYWVGYTASLSMGYTGILPPIMAAWLMPVLFGGIAFYIFKKIPE